MVWLSEEGNENFYEAEPWKDEMFGFCVGYTYSVSRVDSNIMKLFRILSVMKISEN